MGCMADEIVTIACDSCGTQTLVEELHWTANATEVLCSSCYVEPQELPRKRQVPTRNFPIFMLYRDGRLLHVTQDLSTADQWRPLQGEMWWFYSVDSILVKFFESPDQAGFIERRFTHDFAPRYGSQPDVEADLGGEDHTTYHVDVESDRKNLEKTLNVRVSMETYMALNEAARLDGVSRTNWVRSALYEALRASEGPVD